MRTPILLDVDTGIDDAMAIMLAIAHPGLEVRAITCVDGNTTLDGVVANTLRVLDLMDAPRIPVAAGAHRPLLEPSRDAAHVHGSDGLGDLGFPPSTRPVETIHAVELMRRTLEEAERPLTLVALAPLTNLALLLRMYPHVTEQIERVVCMAGSAGIGNATAVAEFNVWHDPEAAQIVLDSGLPILMYGLDVFDAVDVAEETVDALRETETPIAQALAGFLGHRMLIPDADGHAVDGGAADGIEEAPPVPHRPRIGDAGAVAALIAPDLMEIRRYPVQVQTVGIGRGQTIVDRRRLLGEDLAHGIADPWPLVDVVLDADVEAVIHLFLETLGCDEAFRG
ncbi:MAG: nucleoside hydrolase [Brachybacterium sp.]|nr:nucleoside hydrolase [Brachybacterium sp.]